MHSLSLTLKAVRDLNRNARLYLLHTVFSGLSLAVLALLYNLYIQSLGYRQDMIGLVTLVACLVGAAAALPGGLVLARLGYRRALFLGAASAALSIALPLVHPSPEILIATELVWGIGFTLLIVAGGPFMSENSTEETRAQLFSLQFVILTLTAFAGNLFGGELPRWFGSELGAGAQSPAAYQAALWVSVVLMLVSAVPFLFLKPSAPSAVPRTSTRTRLAVEQPRQVAKLLSPHILGALGAGMIVPFANVLWKTEYALPDSTIGLIFAVSALCMAVVGLAAPLLSQRFGMVRTIVAAQGFAALGLLAFGFSPLYGMALAGFLVRDSLSNVLRPLYGQFMMDSSVPTERAAVSALATMGFNLAWGVSSWVSGVLQSENQLAAMFIASVLITLSSAASMHWFFGRQARVPQTVAGPAAAPAE